MSILERHSASFHTYTTVIPVYLVFIAFVIERNMSLLANCTFCMLKNTRHLLYNTRKKTCLFSWTCISVVFRNSLRPLLEFCAALPFSVRAKSHLFLQTF